MDVIYPPRLCRSPFGMIYMYILEYDDIYFHYRCCDYLCVLMPSFCHFVNASCLPGCSCWSTCWLGYGSLDLRPLRHESVCGSSDLFLLWSAAGGCLVLFWRCFVYWLLFVFSEPCTSTSPWFDHLGCGWWCIESPFLALLAVCPVRFVEHFVPRDIGI